MKFAIITHVTHIPKENTFFGYSAYVREMNIWETYASQLLIAAPINKEEITDIHLNYKHKDIKLYQLPYMAFTSVGVSLKTLLNLPMILLQLVKIMSTADHIHLRCPGTIGLMGCLVQVFFPKKPKTAKYAGNWDPSAKQPLSYRIQKWLLSNTLLTHNMQVLVYGNWPNQTQNIKPFFTASYSKHKKVSPRTRPFTIPYRFLFVGTLTSGKRPLYAIQLVEKLFLKGISCQLDIFGDGPESSTLQNYIQSKNLSGIINLHGNKTSKYITIQYKLSDFLLLPSKSEGWPKVVAEAMYWGVVPFVTPISCVPWMLAEGKRGLLLSLHMENDIYTIMQLISSKQRILAISSAAQKWSQQYTLEKFELEIKKLLDL